MKLNTEALAQLRFRARGRWYDGRQVDAFIDELTVAAGEWERELLESDRKLTELQEENAALRAELAALREREQQPAPAAQERERLLADIKALRAFRERFRAAVEHDVEHFGEQAKQLASEELLK